MGTIILFGKPSDQGQQFFDDLLASMQAWSAQQADLKMLRLLMADSEVEAAVSRRLSCYQHQIDGAVFLQDDSGNGVESCLDLLRKNTSFVLRLSADTYEPIKYRVDQSLPVRVKGMNQLVCLRKPEALSYDDWLYNWRTLHTPIAIATQSTFAYRQHVLKAPSDDGILAVVEECFPAAAMADQQVFFNASDELSMQKNMEEMFSSCMRFIDVENLDCVPCSEWIIC